MRYSLGLIITFILFATADVWGGVLDSLRLESRGDQRVVIHQVEAGETIFGLSRRYGASIDDIRETSGLTGNELSIGQQLSIPIADLLSINSDTLSDYVVHEVAAGETLYSISRQYGLTVAELKTLNDMTENTLDLGARLIVGEQSSEGSKVEEDVVETPEVTEVVIDSLPENVHRVGAGETIYSIARRYGVDVTELREVNGLTSNNISIDQQLFIPFDVAGEEPASDTVAIATIAVADTSVVEDTSMLVEVKPAKYGNSDKRDTTNLLPGQMIEEGFAMTIENAPKTKKYLALHRSVPIGTIMQVRNQMNNQSIFVRVVGKLPDTGPNKKVLIRLTQQAFDRLGAIDPKIPVEVAYMRE